MISNPVLISAYAKSHMLEQVMALHGRASSDPKRYRRLLEGMDLPALRRALDEPPDFPAPEETTNAIHCNTGTGASTPARELLPS